MDSKYSYYPQNVQMKKGFLVAVIGINLLFMVYCLVMPDTAIEIVMSSVDKRMIPDYNEADVRELVKSIMFTVCLVGIVFNLILLHGILKQNYCLSVFYAVLAVLSTITALLKAFDYPFFVFNAIVSFLVAIVAILYVQDLKAIRAQENCRRVLFQKLQPHRYLQNMDYNNHELFPPYFQQKKGFLVGVIVFNLVYIVYCLVMLDDATSMIVSMNKNMVHNYSEDEYRELAKTIMLTICIVGIVLELILLYGIVKQSYCLSLCYLILAVLSTFTSISKSFHNYIFAISAIVSIMITLVAFLYVQDLKAIRIAKLNSRRGHDYAL